MTAASPIAYRDEVIHGQAVRIKIMPPAVAPGGWTPGLALSNPGANVGGSFNFRSGFPVPGKDAMAAGRNIGIANTLKRNAKLAEERARRRDAICAVYDANPCAETVHALAEQQGITPGVVANMLREAGRRGVSVAIRSQSKETAE